MKGTRDTKPQYEAPIESFETERANLACCLMTSHNTTHCLPELHSMPRHDPDEDRERIIKRFEADFLDTAAAYEIIRRFSTTSERQGRQGRGGQSLLLVDEAKDFLAIIEVTPTITIKELNDTLRQTFPDKPRVCNVTVL